MDHATAVIPVITISTAKVLDTLMAATTTPPKVKPMKTIPQALTALHRAADGPASGIDRESSHGGRLRHTMRCYKVRSSAFWRSELNGE
jgi:hypothetical protein